MMNASPDSDWERNRRLAEREYRDRKTVLASRPQFLILDPTSRCNARCVMCPQSFRPPGDEGLDLPRAVFDQMAPVIPLAAHLNLFSSGEPTVAADLAGLILEVQRRADPRAKIWLGTNGKHLPPEVMALLREPRLGVQFSVDGGTPEVFESIRRGIAFDEICTSLEQVAQLRGTGTVPRLSFSCVMSKRNLHDLGNIFRLAARYRADQVIVYDEDPETAEEAAFVLDETDRAVFEAQLPVIARTGIRSFLTLNFRGGNPAPPAEAAGPVACSAPWRVFHLHADGSARPCCTLRTTLGTAGSRTFEEVWNGAEYVALRRAFIEQSGIPLACRSCTDPLRDWQP